MDINLSSKLIKYAPAEVQTVTYVVEYAEHNCWDVREIHEYIEAQLKSSRLIEIADILLESKNMATINAKPSGASAKIDSLPAEKSSTDSPATANQRTILGKGASSVKKEEVEFVSEEESDRMNDERLMRGGMGAGRGTTHTAAAKAKSTQSKSAKPDKNTAMSALEIVKRATEAKYGKGSIMSSYEADGEDDLQEGEGSYGQTPKARQAMGKLAIARREKPASEYSQKGEKTKKVKSIEKHTRRIDNGPDAGDRSKKSTKPRYSGFAGKSGRGKLDQDSRDYARDSAVEYTSGGHKPGPGTVTKNPKKLRKQRAMGEISKESFEAWLDEAMTNYEKNRKRAAELKKEEFGAIVTSLVDLGFDLSQYTIDEMVQMCYDAMDQIEIEESCGTKHGSDTKNKKPSKKNYRESFNLPNARVSFSRQEKVVESGPSEEQIAEAAPAIVAAAGRLAASQSVKGAAKKAGTKLATAGVEAIVDKIGDRIAGKRDEEA